MKNENPLWGTNRITVKGCADVVEQCFNIHGHKISVKEFKSLVYNFFPEECKKTDGSYPASFEKYVNKVSADLRKMHNFIDTEQPYELA